MPKFEPADFDKLRWFLLAFAAWSLLAAIPTSSAYIIDGSQGLQRWLWIFGNIAPYYYLWALATPGIYRLYKTWLSPRHGWLPVFLGHFAMCLGLSVLFGIIIHQGAWRVWIYGDIAPGYYAMSAFSYLFILLGIYFFDLHATVRRQDAVIAGERLRTLELEADLAKTQIEMLRNQMNPHFLFNALNCIGALIETRQNDRAYAVLEDLGSLLRSLLEHRDQELVPLREELSIVRRYIAMEQARFGERMRLQFNIDKSAMQWPVPPFVIQTLIENTVKHAVAPSRASVNIEVSAERNSNGIALQVFDDGKEKRRKQDSGGTGVGLENLSKRLQLIYGEGAGLSFVQDESGTTVRLAIPDHRKTAIERPAAENLTGSDQPISLKYI
jgi:hypothetical protein